jgi:hypothetical protein
MFCGLLLGPAAWARPLSAPAQALIPSDAQQITSIDYPSAVESGSLSAMEGSILQPYLLGFENSLREVGVIPALEFQQLTLAIVRPPQTGFGLEGVAQGQFPLAIVKLLLSAKNIQLIGYRTYSIYTLSGTDLTSLNGQTMVFGDHYAIRYALDTYDGYYPNLDANPQLLGLLSALTSAPEWSVLDQRGTQSMVLSALGGAPQLSGYVDSLLTSYYKLNATEKLVSFEMNVVTPDSPTAATLSSVLEAIIQMRLLTATPAEKQALREVIVDTNGSNVRLRFQSTEDGFESLLSTSLFRMLKG